MVFASTKLHVDSNFLAFYQRHILDQQCHHAFAFDGCCALILPYPGKILGQGYDTFTGIADEQVPVRFVLPLMRLLQVIQSSQPLVPVRLEGIGYQPVIGIHLEIAASCQLGFITRLFELRAT